MNPLEEGVEAEENLSSIMDSISSYDSYVPMIFLLPFLLCVILIMDMECNSENGLSLFFFYPNHI
jgi:hypothetical protein